MAHESQGVTLERGDGASPEVFTDVAEIISISGPSGSASVIDTSHLGSTFVEKLMGLPDEGQITFECNFKGGDTAQEGLRADRAARTLRNFQITLTDSPNTVLTFAAYVLSLPFSIATNDKITQSVTLEISGQVTFA